MAREKIELNPEQYGPFLKYLEDSNVTDVEYNGNHLWITDLEKGCYPADEKINENFLIQFTHDVSNVINKPFNHVDNVLEADTDELRITIIDELAAASGLDISIRRSPAIVRNTIADMIDNAYCPEEILHLLINCVLAKMNFVFGGIPGTGKTECAKFFEQFIADNEKVITIEDVLEMHYSKIYPDRNCTELRISKDFTYEDAIKVCLRKNPKWLIMAEARSKEVKFLMQQWSTGVNGFSTIHMEDIRNLADRIINMMENVSNPQLMENTIYKAVNIGILIKFEIMEDGSIRRYMDQVGFYTRENHKNKVYMIMDNAKIVSRELPEDIKRKLDNAKIKDYFHCDQIDEFIRKEKERNERAKEKAKEKRTK